MGKFIKRADRLFDYVVGVDSLFANKKFRPATLKDIIDNLRYYTVLGFLWVGAKALMNEQSNIASYAAVALCLVIFVLLFLVAAQSALIILMSAAGWTMMLLPPRVAVRVRARLRKDDFSIKVGLLGLTLPVALFAVLLAKGLIAALTRAGSL